MIGKTAQGNWRVRVKHKGRVVADRTFDRKADAQTWESEQKRRLALGDWIDPRHGQEPLGQSIDRWLELRRSTVSGKTYQTDEYLFRTYVDDRMRSLPVAAIRPSDIEALLIVTGSRIKRSSVVRFRAALSSFFAWAVRERVIRDNPVVDARVPHGTGTDERDELRPFTLAELRQAHADAVETGGPWGDLVIVLGLTGLRWGELMALRPMDIQQVPYPSIRVSRSAPDGQAIRSATKGGSARSVPLAAELVPILESWAETRQPTDLLFGTRSGNRIGNSNWRRRVNWTVTGQARRIHDLRHTAATLWLTNGIDPKTVQTWLGHASMTLTVDTYAHYMGNDADRAAIARINAILGDATGTTTPKLRVATGETRESDR